MERSGKGRGEGNGVVGWEEEWGEDWGRMRGMETELRGDKGLKEWGLGFGVGVERGERRLKE